MSAKRCLRAGLSSLVYFFLSSPIAAQGLQSAEKPQVTRVVSEAVIVDVIVRDKRGRAVKDLRREEVEVFENGIKQELVSFRRVDSGAIAGSPSGVPGQPKVSPNLGQQQTESSPVRLISLVFDRQNPEGFRLSKDAAMRLLREDLPENILVGVFSAGRRLDVVEPFSRDLRRLKKAVETVTSKGPDQFASISEAIKAELSKRERFARRRRD